MPDLDNLLLSAIGLLVSVALGIAANLLTPLVRDKLALASARWASRRAAQLERRLFEYERYLKSPVLAMSSLTRELCRALVSFLLALFLALTMMGAANMRISVTTSAPFWSVEEKRLELENIGRTYAISRVVLNVTLAFAMFEITSLIRRTRRLENFPAYRDRVRKRIIKLKARASR